MPLQPLPPPVYLATTDVSGHDSGKFQGTRVAVSAPSTLPPPCLWFKGGTIQINFKVHGWLLVLKSYSDSWVTGKHKSLPACMHKDKVISLLVCLSVVVVTTKGNIICTDLQLITLITIILYQLICCIQNILQLHNVMQHHFLCTIGWHGPLLCMITATYT